MAYGDVGGGARRPQGEGGKASTPWQDHTPAATHLDRMRAQAGDEDKPAKYGTLAAKYVSFSVFTPYAIS